MKKISTYFQCFRYDDSLQSGKYQIMWYKLEVDDVEESGVCFTEAEYKQVLDFFIRHPINFLSEGKNYYDCSEEEGSYCDAVGLIPDENRWSPSNFILRRKPTLIPGARQYKCVDVILTTLQGVDNHKYDLPFDIIGQIIT